MHSARLTVVFLAAAAVIAAEPACGQCKVMKLFASDAQEGDEFGSAVAISGDRAVVGAERNDDNSSSSGSAYAFRFDGSSWVQEQKLLPSDGAANDYFGISVAIHGDVAIVGADGDDDDVMGESAGSAYIFRREGSAWVQEQKLLASDGKERDYFGWAVAIQGDVAAVSAWRHSSGGEVVGVYVFRYDGAVWTEEAKLVPSEAAPNPSYGVSLAFDGDTIAVGASGDDGVSVGAGSVFIFRYDGAAWYEDVILVASDGAEFDCFGDSVALCGNLLAVGAAGRDDPITGAGAVYVFRHDGSSWNEEAILVASDVGEHDWLGFRTVVKDDAILAGASGDDNVLGVDAGAAYVFRFDGSDWHQDAKIMPWHYVQGSNQEGYGRHLAIDGNTFMVGSAWDDENIPYAGAVYVFGIDTPDCNDNEVCDWYDLALETSEDCDANGVPDECDVGEPIVFSSGELSPIGVDYPQSYIIESAPAAHTYVSMSFIAYADLSKPYTEYIAVDVNGIPVGVVFDGDAHDCPSIPDEDHLVVPADVFNDAVGGGDATVNMTAYLEVNPFECIDPTYIAVDVAIYVPSDADQNANGIPDECECPADLNYDDQVNIDDLFEILGNWGLCDDPGNCPWDLGGPDGIPDGKVNIDDLFAVLGAWGPCP
ncbi:MAG: hypothetical protein JSV91_13590 [Phycisphaerales bacterium]|nr:MAG: hypothetical protein JSV91_13590 [Phycisphaerales bacterium]